MALENWEEIFVNREDIINELLKTRENYFIFGARKIGKTSLLKNVESKFLENKIPAFYFSIQGYSKSEKIKRKIELCFKRQNFSIDRSLFTSYSFFDFLEELDLKLEQPINLLIDELEQIAEIEKEEPGFIENFANSIESMKNIRFIVTASPHFKKILKKKSCAALLNVFHICYLPVLDKNSILELMKKFVPKIDEYEINQILKFTHHQPYLVKIFIRKLLYKGNLQPLSTTIALDTYIDNALDAILPNYFEGLKKEEKEIVRQIHCNEFKYEQKYETILRELEWYGYLKQEHGKYQISNWFFCHWLDWEFDVKDTLIDEEKLKPAEKLTQDGKSTSLKNENTHRFQFFQSLGGQVLACVCILGGIILSLFGAQGNTNWTTNILGFESNIVDAAPGALLFIVGLLFVLITRFKRKKRIKINLK